MMPVAVGLFVTGEWMPNGKPRLGMEHLMTPILREHALIVEWSRANLKRVIEYEYQHMVRVYQSDPVLEYRWLHVR